jgi:hypothetical protein
LAIAKDEQERYYLARRWRRELPERVFYRVPVEFKPSAADFRSIVLVNLFAKHIRQTQAAGYSVTEMLPDLDQLWLTDGEGWRYSSELRIVAYDSTTEDQDLLRGPIARSPAGYASGGVADRCAKPLPDRLLGDPERPPDAN